MFDFREVTDFERRLRDAAETTDIERSWKRETAGELADAISPPRRTGALAASVRATSEGVAMLDYWRFLEYGTVHMAPRPFVRPAINRQLPRALDDLGDRVLREL